MPRRVILTARQRAALFDLPDSEGAAIARCTLSDADMAAVNRRQGDANRLGFALQLCAFRHPGRLIQPGEIIPAPMLDFVAAQIGVDPQVATTYAVTGTTHYRHSSDLQRLYGYRPCSGQALTEMKAWLLDAAGAAPTNADLAAACVEEMRKRKVIVPGPTTVERLCGAALVLAERKAIAIIAEQLDADMRDRLEKLITETADGRVSRFVWLRRIETGANTADMGRLFDRLDVIEGLGIPADLLEGLPRRRIDRLRGEGERLYVDSLKKMPTDRRLSIVGASVVEWRAALLDAVIETQDRILGGIFRDAKLQHAETLETERTTVAEALRALRTLTNTLIDARAEAIDLDDAIESAVGWDELPRLAVAADRLSGRVGADPIDFIGVGHARIRRYAKRMLATVSLNGGRSAKSLLTQVEVLKRMYEAPRRTLPDGADAGFALPKWRRRIIGPDGALDPQAWEIAVLFSLRDRLRSGDVWAPGARRYQELDAALPPLPSIAKTPELAIPLTAEPWLAGRKAKLEALMARVAAAASADRLANARIHDGVLTLARPERALPEASADLALDLYCRVPPLPITDLLRGVARETGFVEAFTELRTGAPPRDELALLTVILADGLNMGLSKMAQACPAFTFHELTRVATWHVRQETYARALATVVEAQAALPMARFWGEGTTSSSDGQFFPTGGMGEALNVVNLRYGSEPGTKIYTHVSDRYAPYHATRIAATAFEAPYILDGLVNTAIGRRTREHFADTGGFTDHVFAVSALLGHAFAPRIRNLADRRLYVFGRASVPAALDPLVGGTVRVNLIRECWPDILRMIAAIASGAVVPSHLLRQLAAYPKRNAVAIALREIGRIERSIFMLSWLTDVTLQRRQQAGLNKGEAHHALKSALCINRRGEFRDRTADRQSVRAAGLNFLAAAVIHHNTAALSRVVADLVEKGSPPDPTLLGHVSPLPWEHILITGKYSWND